MRLNKEFFENKDSVKLAKDLLGKLIVKETENGIISGIINETEAYREDDEASHSFGGNKTKRNQVMFNEYGHLYVYFTYGMYHCVNIVSESKGYGAAVLIRSIIPVDGIEQMIKNRKWENKNLKDLSNGPAKLCIALDINKNCNGLNILDNKSNIYLKDIGYKFDKIHKSSRIGINKAIEKNGDFIFK